MAREDSRELPARKAQQWWAQGQLSAADGTLYWSKEWATSSNRFFNTLSPSPQPPTPSAAAIRCFRVDFDMRQRFCYR